MKTTVQLTIFTLVCLTCTKATALRGKRGSYSNSYGYQPHFDLYEPLRIPLHETQLYSLGIDTFLPIPQGTGFLVTGTYHQDQYFFHGTNSNTLSVSKANIVPVALSNSVEKPVQEPSDLVPQPSTGTAVIPLTPPPAVPVNAAAANVPSNNGAVFLGSGALGVINLGNGAFALGSGGIGYSDIRQQPRPNGLSPLFPPLAATPNLVPAATPSQQPASIPQPNLTSQLSTNDYQFNQPVFVPTGPQKQLDQNGYERLDANAAGFGMPTPTPLFRALKTRNNYATPTVRQVQVEAVHSSQLPASGFGEPIPRFLPQAITYN